MRQTFLTSILVGILAGQATTDAIIKKGSNPQPFKVDLSKGVPRLLELANQTQLPGDEEYPGVGSKFGIDLGVLKSLRQEWTTSFDWEKEELSINKYKQYTTIIEGLTIHFIHEKSAAANAIPLILNHGWPGSFLEFVPVIDPLLIPANSSVGSPVSFDIVVPSLPGYAFSSPPPANWTIDDTARIFNTLMTEILGYKSYAVHGTDWGSGVGYSLYNKFNATVRALHLNFLPFLPWLPDQLAAANISLSPNEKFQAQRTVEWNTSGNGYFVEQATRPNTIGLALYDNPIGQLSWIGEKFIAWSDPRAGTQPSILTHNEILREISLYYLTRSIVSSVYTYAQNPSAFLTEYTKADNDAPFLFSNFLYNVAFWPVELVDKVGNLVFYNSHEFGGHFPGLDNPPALIRDLREIGKYWSG